MPGVIEAIGVSAIAKAFLTYVASQLLSNAFAKKPKDQTADRKNYGFQVNSQSTRVPLPLLYGQSRVGINRPYITTSGSDNEYLHIIGIIGEGPIEGFSDQINGVDPLYLNNRLYTKYGADNVHYELFRGTSTQTVCETLHNDVLEWNDCLRRTAYIYVKLKFDRDKFQGIPEITLGLKGLKLYNPTTSITEYSNNPALCVYDILTRSPWRGGYGLSRSQMDVSSVEAARQYCEDYGWTCNMPIVDDIAITDNIQLLLNNFRGELIQSKNLFSLKFRDLREEVVVDSFSDQVPLDIVAGSFKLSDPDVFNAYTAVRINYISRKGASNGSSSFKKKSFVLHAPGVSESDGGYKEYVIDCLGLNELDVVQKMAYYLLERLQSSKHCSFVAGHRATRLEPLDLITVTHTVPGWINKIVRVLNPVINPDYTVTLECIEENSAFYDGRYDPSLEEWHDTTLPDPTDGPGSVLNVSLVEEVYYYRGRSFTRLKCNFSRPDASVDPFWDYAEVYLKIGAGEYRYMTRSEGNYQVDPVEEGETYFIKLRSVNINGVRQPELDAYVASKTIDGKTETPTSLTSMTAAANGDSVTIFSDPLSDPDIEGYEVRLGDAWDGAVFVSFNKNCSLRLIGVRPGTHTFWMSPRDNAGRYSADPVSATVTVFIPPGYTQLPTYGSWSWDFVSGTHDNTESVTYNSQDALKCSHTDGVLSGTFTSPTFDLGAVETVRIWGDFLTAFVSSGTTWDGVTPEGVTWDMLGSGTWNAIFRPSQAGKIEAVLKFSTDNVNWSDIGFFQVLSAEVYARYIKVEVTITDPTIDSNLYLYSLNMLAYEGPQG